MFGYRTEESENAANVWGARAIVEGESFSLVHNRQGCKGDFDALAAVLNGNVLKLVHERVAALRKSGEIRNDEATEHVLYDDDVVKVVGNTNASYGYLYLVAFLKED